MYLLSRGHLILAHSYPVFAHDGKPNLHQKNVMVTGWWSAAHLIHYSFLNPGETITFERSAQQIDEMYWKLQRLQPALVNRKGTVLHNSTRWLHVAQPVFQKLNELDCKVLPQSSYSPDLSPLTITSSRISTAFLQGKWFNNQQEAEKALQEFVEFQSTDFYAPEINRLTSHWQKCVGCNGSYFD